MNPTEALRGTPGRYRTTPFRGAFDEAAVLSRRREVCLDYGLPTGLVLSPLEQSAVEPPEISLSCPGERIRTLLAFNLRVFLICFIVWPFVPSAAVSVDETNVAAHTQSAIDGDAYCRGRNAAKSACVRSGLPASSHAPTRCESARLQLYASRLDSFGLLFACREDQSSLFPNLRTMGCASRSSALKIAEGTPVVVLKALRIFIYQKRGVLQASHVRSVISAR